MKTQLSIQERLKDLRVEKGLTLEHLSQQTKTPASTLGSYESDDYKECYAIEPHFGGVRYKTLTMSEMRPQCLVNQGFFRPYCVT